MVDGVQEDARQRVIIGGRNGIVFVIEAARASHRHAEEPAGDHVYPIVPLVGMGDLHRPVVVIPGTLPQESRARQRLHADGRIEQIARDLRLDEQVG